jgi:hypothetical protein
MTARGPSAAATDTASPAHPITQAALVEYLATGVVLELVVRQTAPGAYRLEASLSWRSGRSTLVTARGDVREFRSLDTLATFLKTAGIGSTLVRLELSL